MGIDTLMGETQEPTESIPEFSLPASTGQTLSFESFQGKVPLIIVFVDVESAEGLDLLGELSSRHRDFGKVRAQILAVARATARETRRIADEMGISVPILADASGVMAREYDAEDDGGSTRQVAVVADKEGRLHKRFDPLPSEDGPPGVIEALLSELRAVG